MPQSLRRRDADRRAAMLKQRREAAEVGMQSDGLASPTIAANSAEGPSRRVWLYLAIIVATWACNWPLMKLALGEIAPFAFALLRMTGAVGLLTAWLMLTGQKLLPVAGERWALFWVGQAQVSGFILFSIVGLAIVPAGRAIVLAYTMPLWAIPLGRLVAPEPMPWPKIIGAGVGFFGLVVFMSPRLIDWGSGRALFGNLCLLLAAIAWALGACLYRRRRWATPFWAQTWWQLAGGCGATALAAIIVRTDIAAGLTPLVVAILVYNWIVTTVLGYFLWNRVLTLLPPAVAGQVVTLTPVGGFVLSVLMFGGAVGADTMAGIALIVAGLALTLRSR
jgi:drug/metabolite transporter (DMT)-like permease